MPVEKRSRPDKLVGISVEIQTCNGPMNVTMNFLEGDAFEVFARIAKAGTGYMCMTEAIARLVSLLLRCGISPEDVAHQLDGIGGKFKMEPTIPDAIAKVLKGEYGTLA